ncbi:transcription initiation factor tfiid [Anaeramoeba ignava]|uniref:Transcription initiation factor tfiid n=1 Tax=Anaeramoeba ignava TaxID=1746090 RepID=A0A9Q0R5Y9_ANAIG|nr:transcription initiation factor tfiid [Anaeramoeba ignava]
MGHSDGDENGEVVVWDIGQGEAVYKFGSKKPIISNSLQIGSKKQAIWSLQFSPFDGNILVAGTQDSSIRFFDLSSYISDPSHDLSTPNNSLVHVGFSSREILRAVGIRNVD